MNEQRANMKITSKLMFRLLPVQILLAVVGAVNGIVSSFFATNFIGINAMSAVGLYNPVNLLVTAISMMLMGGSTILCGKYMGQNQQEKLQNNFSLNMIVSACVAAVFTLLLVILAMFDLTGFITKDPAVRPGFNRYLLGMAIGIFPLVVGNQLTSFLSIENERRRTTIASLVYIAVNVVLNFFLVKKLQMEARGLALASSGGLWVFFLIQAVYFTTGKSHFRLKIRNLRWEESADIIRIGLPGAAGLRRVRHHDPGQGGGRRLL